MTRGGPARASETTSIFLYRQALVLHNFGYASTMGVILFAVVGVAAFLMMRRRFAA